MSAWGEDHAVGRYDNESISSKVPQGLWRVSADQFIGFRDDGSSCIRYTYKR